MADDSEKRPMFEVTVDLWSSLLAELPNEDRFMIVVWLAAFVIKAEGFSQAREKMALNHLRTAVFKVLPRIRKAKEGDVGYYTEGSYPIKH